jgi:hypothetical protein
VLVSFKGAYWIGKFKFFIYRIGKFQYWDSNIVLFSIAPPLVIALPTLRWQSCRSYSLLKARAKSKGNIIALLALEGDSDMCTFTLR